MTQGDGHAAADTLQATPEAYKTPIESPVYFTPTTSFFSALNGNIGRGFCIRGEDRRLVRLQNLRWFSDVGMELCLPGRRLRLDRPKDRGWGEGWAFFSMPRRRMVWRAGSCVAAEIRETSQSAKELSGGFTLSGQRYNVRCQRSGLSARGYDRELLDASGVIATLEVNRAASGLVVREYIAWPQRPVPLDALAIGLHLMFWLQQGVGGGAAGAGGGGGGGGGC
ncbi:hypothetical protein IC757_11215 [Wenzhouxiangella sp. AB-CW3]|uniref:hypothetical protein n=1 Tax=Wenzhouxiangella sp. AB-CW3 TaxID=2771012 RepID=UPI00168AE20E|nr:hypothetical protein [Wenzhouxiangella sp. AB-CW3]QOC21609.1 hypothetical protein IC757_11215 [Wenzhouxiangella sp. AB-CW3]